MSQSRTDLSYVTRIHTKMDTLNVFQSMYSTLWTSKYAFVHCIFPSLSSGKYNREESITAVLHVPVEGTDQSPFPALPMAWSVCFSFFITETAVNYWLTWVLITMQIWGKMKSKAAGSCHIRLQKIHDWREGLLWARFMLSNGSEMKREKI